MALSRHAAVESYRAWLVVDRHHRTPAMLRRSRPMVMPSARTKNAGQPLSGADEFGQLIHTWLQAAAVVIAAGIVMPG